jgi:hypothetical protein
MPSNIERNTFEFRTRNTTWHKKPGSSSTISRPSKWLMGLGQREVELFSISNFGTDSSNEFYNRNGLKKIEILHSRVYRESTKHDCSFPCSIFREKIVRYL